MLLVTPAAEAAARRRPVEVNGRTYHLDGYVGAAPERGHYVEGNERNDNGLPQAFLVHQPPGAITPAHFHEPNQFQVFVGGNGRIGAKPATPLTVQYANGHTPYGPIVAGPDGVMYFTLRQRWDPGAKYVPASSALLVKGRQRTRVKGDLGIADAGARRARTAPTTEVVFAREPDGMSADLHRLGPGQSVACGLTGGDGLYLVVTAGAIRHAGADLPELSTVYLTAGEPALTVTAGPDGADVLALQFPRLRPAAPAASPPPASI